MKKYLMLLAGILTCFMMTSCEELSPEQNAAIFGGAFTTGAAAASGNTDATIQALKATQDALISASAQQ